MAVPTVVRGRVYPVAGYDSMLLNLAGAHGPYFTRDVVVLEDSAGNLGIGEVPGGPRITQAIEDALSLVIGQPLSRWRRTVQQVQNAMQGRDAANIFWTYEQTAIHAITAIETALLDLFGKYLGVPVCELLGDGQQRERVPVLGYLFFVGDPDGTPAPYQREKVRTDGIPQAESSAHAAWYAMRREKAMDSEAIVAQAKAVGEAYGFRDFKLKGGVLSGQEEIQVLAALREAFPEARLTIDPNGAWSLAESVELLSGWQGKIAYAEDPCGAEGKFSGREVLAEFRRLTNIPTATNMVATNWRELASTLFLQAVSIPLADPHFWTMSGAVRVAQLCHDLGLTWGCHSNNHFDISLAMAVQCGAAAPGPINALDTHWIWQEGAERLTVDPPRIRGGHVEIGAKPGLGVEIDMERLAEAHELYLAADLGARDDAVGMQSIIPGWTFDPHRPALVR